MLWIEFNIWWLFCWIGYLESSYVCLIYEYKVWSFIVLGGSNKLVIYSLDILVNFGF